MGWFKKDNKCYREWDYIPLHCECLKFVKSNYDGNIYQLFDRYKGRF